MPRKSLSNPADIEEIIERLQRIQPSSQRRWGRMSPHQMLCHLSDAYRIPLGEKKVSPAPVRLPRSLMKWWALAVPVRWPRGLNGPPEVDQLQGGTRPAEFEQDRQQLLRLLQRFCLPATDLDRRPHPFFGSMQERDWMRWGFLHADHHLRQFGM